LFGLLRLTGIPMRLGTVEGLRNRELRRNWKILFRHHGILEQ